jgi:hypothetical protein
MQPRATTHREREHGGQRQRECCELNQDETLPFELVSQRHQQRKARGETELGCRWHQPDHCGLARKGGFHDAEHGLVILGVGCRHAARNRQRHAQAESTRTVAGCLPPATTGSVNGQGLPLLGVAVMIQRFACAALQEIGIDLHRRRRLVTHEYRPERV